MEPTNLEESSINSHSRDNTLPAISARKWGTSRLTAQRRRLKKNQKLSLLTTATNQGITALIALTRVIKSHIRRSPTREYCTT